MPTKPPTIPFTIVACTFSDNISRNSCIYIIICTHMCVSDKPLACQKQNDIILLFFPQTKREEQLVILARWLKSLTVSSSTIPAGVFCGMLNSHLPLYLCMTLKCSCEDKTKEWYFSSVHPTHDPKYFWANGSSCHCYLQYHYWGLSP